MKILISDPIGDEIIEELKNYGTLLAKGEEAKADIIIVRSSTRVDNDYIDKAKNLKLIIRAGSGMDNIVDIDYCIKKGIKVENIPDASSIAVAELVFAHMLAIARNVVYCDSTIKKCEWRKKELIGFELYGKTLGIIGLGRIGKAVAERAKAFGMDILVYDPFVRNSEYELVELSQLLTKSDIITLHVPLNGSTKNMIGKNEFGLMKNGVVIINTSRGGVINEDELLKNLKNRKLSFAGLDVFREEPLGNSSLRKLDNVILTPHIGSQTVETKRRIEKSIIEKIKLFKNKSEKNKSNANSNY